MTDKAITIHNAGTCTAYELRQELNKRNAFDLDENKVTFKTLLQRLMVELVAEEAKKDAAKVETALEVSNNARDAAKADREKKKAEALERSRQRQANPEYFAQKGVANSEGVALKAKLMSQETSTVEIVEEEEESTEPSNDDPFRSYVSKSKNKISVK